MAISIAISSVAMSQALGTGSEGEELLKAVTDQDGAKAIALLDQPGSHVVNYRGYNGDTALHIATRNRNSTWTLYLLSKGADPNVGDRNGDTALIIASRMGFDEAVEVMLARRGNPNAANRMGETALIAAVQQRQIAVVRRLLEAGADPDKADHAAGLSARDYAKRDSRNPEILKLIETTKSTAKKAVGPSIN